MGGGFISYCKAGWQVDHFLGIQYSYIVVVICFAYLAFYGWKANTLLKLQGIDYDPKKVEH